MKSIDQLPKAILGGTPDDDGGAYEFSRNAQFIRVVASWSDGWDHVSVSLKDRCPTWEEMEYVKRLFFKDDEYAMQLHVPPSAHINCHPYCLHMWRPQEGAIPIPPAWMVGPRQTA